MLRSSKRLTMSDHRGHGKHGIEDLPDCILHHILSYMPTKEVVKTSALSKRWKNLWVFVPNIDFDDGLLSTIVVDGRRRPNMSSFVNFVERVLLLRDARITEKFRLSCCCAFHHPSRIHSWISYAIVHKVQELELSLSSKLPSMIPWSMFDGTSLISLKLRLSCVIKLPSHVSFPCLKTLHLSFAPFPNDAFTIQLLSGCPVLEELVLTKCCFKNLKNIAITSTTIRSLIIRDLSCLGPRDDPRGCQINIDAANLKYFSYTGYQLNKIFFIKTPSLDKSFINILNNDEKRLNDVAYRAIDLFKQLQCVVSLKLSNCTLQTLLFADYRRLQDFQNLTHLLLTTEISMNHAFRVLMCLLSFCPVLQSISFSEGFLYNMQLQENDSIWSSIPKCISNCLKTVTLKKFHGYNSEICFLKYVLKYACLLERIDICWSDSYVWDLERKTNVRKDLEKIEKSSTACVIKFS